MDLKEAIEILKKKPEIAKSLASAIDKNANTSELSEILVQAGIAAEDVDNLISEYQRKRGLAISNDDLDEEELKKVAGGGSGVNCTFEDDCDSSFKDSSNWGFKRCNYNEYCDELLGILY